MLDPLGRAGVGGALVAALDDAERVEGLHHAGRRGRGAPREAASPDIQKCACTTSGRLAPPSGAARSPPKAGMYGSRSSFGTGSGGPGVDVLDRSRPAPSGTRSRQVGVVPPGVDGDLVAARRPAPGASAATWTFWPPASTPPSDRQRAGVLGHHGDRRHRVTSVSSRPSRPGSARARSARARPRGRCRPSARPGPGRARKRAHGARPARRRSVETTPAPGGTASSGLGRGQRDHRHAELHRLEQRQPERGPADRVQVDPAPGQLVVQLGLRQVLDAAAVRRQAQVAGSASVPMPNTSSGAACGEAAAAGRCRSTRPRRTGSLTTTAARASSPV